MILKSEIDALNELYAGRESVCLEDFLYEDEIDILKNVNKFGTFTYKNLTNKLIYNISKSHSRHNVTLQNLWHDFDLANYIEEISGKIRYSELTDIKIAFSFIARNTKTNEKSYFYAAKAFSTNFSHRISSKAEMMNIAGEMRKRSDQDHLMNTFLVSQENNRFRSSGWVPESLVCCYVYLTK